MQVQNLKDILQCSTESHFDQWEVKVSVLTSLVVHEYQEFWTWRNLQTYPSIQPVKCEKGAGTYKCLRKLGAHSSYRMRFVEGFWQSVASLMSPVAPLVTTDRCSNVSMCWRISTKSFIFPGIVPLLYSVGNLSLNDIPNCICRWFAFICKRY